MSVGLLDVNVLIALAWPSHIHHTSAHAWFARNATKGWATCPVTQMGFVRISSNPKIIPEAVSPSQALHALDRMTRHESHIFWPDDIALTECSPDRPWIVGHRQVTDAYLLSLALHNEGKLVTFDDSISSLLAADKRKQNAIVLIEAGRRPKRGRM